MHVPASISIFLAACSVHAYQVISPGGAQGWNTVGPNYLTWERVDTDPLNFTAVLTNMNTQVMPTGQVLNDLVDGTLGKIACNPPSGGWPTGSGFRVNLAQDAEHLDSLLAQSGQFNITASTTTASTSISSPSMTLQTTGTSTTTAPYISAVSSSDTSTSPTGISAAAASADTTTGFLVSFTALIALMTTVF